MFYVAITRARNNICFYEEEDCKLYNELSEYIDYVDEFNEQKLNLHIKSTSDDYYREGKYLESKGKYKHAISQYQKSKIIDSQKHIKRCEALILNEKGQYIESGDLLYDIQEYYLALDSYKSAMNTTGILKCLVMLEKTYEEIQTELLTFDTKVTDVVLNNKNNEKWHKQYFEILDSYLEKRLNAQKQTVDLIEYTIQGLK